MVNHEEICRVAEAVRQAESIALCSHVNPDGDTVGTGAAVRLGLMSLGKRVAWFCQDAVPDDMHILAGWESCRAADTLAPEERFDLLLCVDISDDYRMGTAQELLHRCSHSAQLDHHATNPRAWTEVSAVDGDASACAVVAYALLKELGVSITKEIAVCLYAGISTDTGNFSYSLQPETFAVMAELMSGPLTPSEVQQLHRHLFDQRAIPVVRLLERALSSLTFTADGTVTTMRLTREDFAACGADQQHANIIVNYGLDILGVKATVLARDTLGGEKENGIKLSFRSVRPYDIAQVARSFGGGGHEQAAGATVIGRSMEELLAAAQQALIDVTR